MDGARGWNDDHSTILAHERPFGRQVQQATTRAEKLIETAAKTLGELGLSAADIRALVDLRIAERIADDERGR